VRIYKKQTIIKMLGRLIRVERAKQEITQDQLRISAGISQTYLSAIENDRAFPRKETLESILKVLKVKLEFVADEV